jgi:hypothetical protein
MSKRRVRGIGQGKVCVLNDLRIEQLGCRAEHFDGHCSPNSAYAIFKTWLMNIGKNFIL